jgi:hypothetical protein
VTSQAQTSEMRSRVVAVIILQQLGGKRFITMTRSKNFIAIGNRLGGLFFQIGFCKGYMSIILDYDDTYKVEFKTLRGRLLKKYSGVYCENLRGIFQEETGLLTSL